MKEDLEIKLPPGVVQSLQQHMNSLETALLASDPDMPSYLKESHKLLISYPETVWLLEDAEIKLLLDAAQKFTDTKILEAMAKKASGRKGGKGAAGMTADML